jgi:creatinine amidohydrolase
LAQRKAVVLLYFPEHIDEAATRRLAPTVLGQEGIAKWQNGGSAARSVIPEGYYGNPALIEPGKAAALVES